MLIEELVRIVLSFSGLQASLNQVCATWHRAFQSVSCEDGVEMRARMLQGCGDLSRTTRERIKKYGPLDRNVMALVVNSIDVICRAIESDAVDVYALIHIGGTSQEFTDSETLFYKAVSCNAWGCLNFMSRVTTSPHRMHTWLVAAMNSEYFLPHQQKCLDAFACQWFEKHPCALRNPLCTLSCASSAATVRTMALHCVSVGNLDAVRVLSERFDKNIASAAVARASEARHNHVLRYLLRRFRRAQSVTLADVVQWASVDVVALVVKRSASPTVSSLVFQQAGLNEDTRVMRYVFRHCYVLLQRGHVMLPFWYNC